MRCGGQSGPCRVLSLFALGLAPPVVAWALAGDVSFEQAKQIGRENGVHRHVRDEEEFQLPVLELVQLGRSLFSAVWTDQDGAGRPYSKGTGARLVDSTRPLTGAEAFNRISGPDANSCSGCHNVPFAFPGGGGDIVTNAFVGAERFDFVTFDRSDTRRTRGSLDEAGNPVTLQTVGNSRATPGLFGAGYIEMLARQMTDDLQQIRNGVRPGESIPLSSKGVSFGVLTRSRNGAWDTSKVVGLSAQSVRVATPGTRPTLVIRPWRQSGSAISLREMSNDSYNAHLGIQSVEKFGRDTDPDGDGIRNEMTRGDVTAAVLFMATLQVPGRVIANDSAVERAVMIGERLFDQIGCSTCHIPSLMLDRNGWIYSAPEVNVGRAARMGRRHVQVDLTSADLPQPRLNPTGATPVVRVPAYTDLKLHDITDPADPEASEPLDINERRGSPAFLRGNRKFLTARLWGAANQPPYFHHGLFTTLREAVVAHSGEALNERRAFEALTTHNQDAVLQFLRSLQVLPPGTNSLVVDDQNRPKVWPPQSLPTGVR